MAERGSGREVEERRRGEEMLGRPGGGGEEVTSLPPPAAAEAEKSRVREDETKSLDTPSFHTHLPGIFSRQITYSTTFLTELILFDCRHTHCHVMR